MKKLSLVLISLMVFFSAGISILAETIEQKDVDVTVQYIQTAEGFNQAPVKNGEGSLTTEEGVKVSVSGAPGNARYLVVCPILRQIQIILKFTVFLQMEQPLCQIILLKTAA